MARMGFLRCVVLCLCVIKAHATLVEDLAGDIAGPVGDENVFEQCWERCYQIIDGTEYERYRPAWKEFYEMGMEARRLKNMRSVNGTVFLLDSTLDDWHDSAVNGDLQEEEKGENIWQFQRDLASIVAFHLDSENARNPISITQFNHDAAWDCNSHTCLDCCQAVDIIQASSGTERLEPLQMNANSDRDANIEPACRLGYKNLGEPDASLSCNATICNEMAIAFVNSDFHHHVHSDDDWDDYSPCDEHFDTRLPIGTHAVDYHELKSWASLDARPQYIKDNPYTFEAARDLVQCMQSRCCTGSTAQVQSSDCAISTDHFGEDAISYASHIELAVPV